METTMENIETVATTEAEATSEAEDSPVPQLSAIELRVLGALMEKQLTTPDTYPLTLNSLANACNQKSNREPVTNYHEGELKRCMQGLEDKKFVRVEMGSRSDKYTQQFIKQLDLGRKHQALLCVMMLRGPQTLSELDTRTQRMGEFIDREDLLHHIDRLCVRQTPYALRMAQQPGQREGRICHLFSGKPDVGSVDDNRINTGAPSYESEHEETNSSTQNEAILKLENQVASLQTLVNVLESEVEDLRGQVEKLNQLSGNS